MTVRIAEIHRALKPTGSFYLHCDPTASHYLKLVCDALFVTRGGDFKNEITWKRTSAHSTAKRYGSNTDTIFYYTKSNQYTWNQLYSDFDFKHLSKFSRKDPDGRLWYDDNLTGAGTTNGITGEDWRGFSVRAIGRHWRTTHDELERLVEENKIHFPPKNGFPRLKRYLEGAKGVALQEVWDDIFAINSQAAERLGYPTQKPEALLERIISASSNERDVVLDAFCGCGTTIAVAQWLKRRWIGIDITYQSISLIMKRLKKIENAAELVEMHGIPRDMESVRALVHKRDDRVRKEFEKWAVLTFSDNHAAINEKKGADKGIDGVAYTVTGRDDKGNITSSPVIFSVKSGKIGRKEMAELRGTIEREQAAAGVLITLEKPTKPMLNEAKQAGQFKGDFATFDRLQIVTVQDILDNKRMNLPLYGEVLKNAKTDSGAKQPSLYGE